MSDNEGFSKEELVQLAELGASLRAARQGAGLTQQVVASRAELQRSYVAGVEAGTRNISVLNLARIARAVGLDVLELPVIASAESGTPSAQANLPTRRP
jgi:transcriptional regulator with XRE-family HTH domain